MRKKRLLIAGLAILVALAAFCFWYTRPRTWEALPHTGSGEIREITLGVTHFQPHSSDREAAGITSDHYELSLTGDDPLAAEVMALLETNRYRPQLRSIFRPDTLSGRGDTGGEEDYWFVSAYGMIIYADETVCHFSLQGSWVLFNGEGGFYIATAEDTSLEQRLGQLIMTHGALKE